MGDVGAIIESTESGAEVFGMYKGPNISYTGLSRISTGGVIYICFLSHMWVEVSEPSSITGTVVARITSESWLLTWNSLSRDMFACVTLMSPSLRECGRVG